MVELLGDGIQVRPLMDDFSTFGQLLWMSPLVFSFVGRYQDGQRPDPRIVLYRGHNPDRRERLGHLPAVTTTRDQLMLGDLRRDLGQLDHLPAFTTGLRPTGKALTAARAHPGSCSITAFGTATYSRVTPT